MLKTLPGTRVVDKYRINRGNFGGVFFQERISANPALFFAGEQDEGDRALRLPAQRLQRACSLKRGHRAGAIVQRALSEVP